MDLKERFRIIRDEKLQEQSLYNNNQRIVESTSEKLVSVVASISEEDTNYFNRYGIDIQSVRDVDVEKFKEDIQYRQSYILNLQRVLEETANRLEETK